MRKIIPYNKTCQTDLSYTYQFEEHFIIAIQIVSIVTFIASFTTNAMLLYIIIRTKQLKNTSVLIVFHFGLANFGMSISNAFLIGYFHLKEINCIYEYALLFILTETMQSAAFMVVVIAYDRYLKVSCLNLYSQKMTRRKVTIICAIMRLFALVNATFVTATSVNTHNKNLKLSASVIRVVLNVVMLFLCAYFYIKAILAVRSHRQNSQNRDLLKQVDTSVRKLSTFYLASVTVLYLPAIFSDFTRQLAEYRGVLHVSYVLSTLLIFMNPTLNAVVFMILNRPAKRYLRTFFHRNAIVADGSIHRRRSANAVKPSTEAEHQKGTSITSVVG